MSELIDQNLNDNDDTLQKRIIFKLAQSHMQDLYRQNPLMRGLARRAVKSAREEARVLVAEINQNEEEKEKLRIQCFFEDFNYDFIDKCKRNKGVQAGVANPDDNPDHLNRYGVEFTETEQLIIRGIRQAICDDPEADESDFVRWGRDTAGEMLLEADRERRARREQDERLRKLFGPNDGYLLRHVLSGDIEESTGA